MADQPGVRPAVVHAAYGVMYLIVTLAGVYGLFRPAGQVQALYGSITNTFLLAVFAAGGLLGLWASVFQLRRLELLGAPLLTVAVVIITPALFYAELRSRQTAWYGWLSITMALSFLARFLDVRHLLIEQRRLRYQHRHGRER